MIGQTIKSIRLDKSMSQVELSNLVGVTQVEISNIERGIRNPKPKTLSNIALALNTTTEEIRNAETVIR